MTVEAWNRTPEYTISGTGPYAITHPYAAGAIVAQVRLDTGLLILNPSEFSVTPEAGEVEGNLFLSSGAATAHAGRRLIIDRVTPDEQGWLGVQGEREKGLEAQLDRTVQSVQELRARGDGALRIRGTLDPFDWAEGTVPLRQGNQVVSGPTAAQIAQAEARAAAAEVFAQAAAASAAEAAARELSMLRDRGMWATAILYSPSDIFTYDDGGGRRSYITQVAHFATNIPDDLTAGRIRIFADRGAAGSGSGDVLAVNAGSEYTAVAAAFRANVGLGTLAVKSLAAFADLDPSAIITALETLAANKTVENALPTAKAVADYIDGLLQSGNSGSLPTTSGTTVNFNSVPAGVARVKVHYGGVSLDGTNELLMRIGPSSGVETAGYFGAGETSGSDVGSATGFIMRLNGAARHLYGVGELVRGPGTSTWSWSFTGAAENAGVMNSVKSGGQKTITGDLARIQLRPTGSNNFDAGSVLYEWFYY